MQASSRLSLSAPVLCLVTDPALTTRPLDGVVGECVAAGVDLVQVRARSLSGRSLLAHTERILRAARDAAGASDRTVRVVVNRRVDVALACGADGVHLGFDGMPVADARRCLGPDAWIGVSAHDPGEVAAAGAAGADYAHLAPIHAPLSKAASRVPLGPAALTEAARSRLPTLAQGGITPENAAACLLAGAAGVAVTGTLLQAADPGAATRALRSHLDSGRPSLRAPR
ncbi:MAG: thiamine phosphate synthase [Myxococcota bacterium]